MTADSVLLAATLNATAASLLFVAGLGKLAAPAGPLLAIHELVGPQRHLIRITVVRWLAALEVLAGLTLISAATRASGAMLVAGLAACFTAAGITGMLRNSRTPCGCFGNSAGHALGAGTVAVGLLLLLTLPFNRWISLSAGSAGDYARIASLCAVFGSLTLSMWIHRRLAVPLVRSRMGTKRTMAA